MREKIDFSRLSDDELERIINSGQSSKEAKSTQSPDFSKMSDEDLMAITGETPEQEGWKGIGHDVLESIKEAPGEVWQGLKQLPGEVSGAAEQITDPARLARNLLAGFAGFGQEVANTPRNIADYLAKKKIITEETAKKLPRDELDIFKALGGTGHKKGDILLRGLASPYAAAGELGALTKLGRVGARTAAGAAQAIGENQNPITGGLSQAALGQGLEAGIKGLIAAPRTLANLPENIRTGFANQVLNKARRDIETGASLTPEKAAQNALTNYTNIEGQPMGADFGTLIGNKMLQDIYNVSSKIPFSGGRAQLTKLDKQLFDKKETLAKLENEKEKGNLSKQQKKYETDLRSSIADMNHAKQLQEQDLPRVEQELQATKQQHNKLNTHTNQAPELLNSFAQPEIKHSDFLKQESSNAFNTIRDESNKLYEPVNEHEFDTKNINKVEDFPHYLDSLKRHHIEASNLRDIFGNSSDLGRSVNHELDAALTFINSKEQPTLGSILEHTKSLGRLAEYAKEAGKRHEAATLMEMRRSLKEDAKNLLRKQGSSDVADALEQADAHYIKQVLPWYANKEIRKSVTDKNYKPNPEKFANAIHGENAEAILSTLSPEARRATIFELITKNAQTPGRRTTLTSEEIGNRYRTQLDPKVKEALKTIDPALNEYFEGLNTAHHQAKETGRQLTRLQADRQHLESRIDSITGRASNAQSKAQERIIKTQEQTKEAQTKFNEAMKERFGKPKPKTKSIFAALKNFSPLNAAGLGTALYAMGHITPARIIEALGGSPLPARMANEVLTNPELLKNYFEGRKVESKAKQAANLEQKIKKGLSKAIVRSTYGKDKKNKPLEIELIKAFKRK